MNVYRIPEIAKPYIEYDMIEQYTELPRFPDFRTRLLYLFLSSNPQQAGKSELFSLVTSLMQMALDTHEMISVHSRDKELKAARSRQLKVLAGDYFSSRFYFLLSKAGQIELVASMARAIGEVNRMKMALYTGMKQWKVTADDYMRQTVEINIELYMSFQSLIGEVYGDLWPTILRAFGKTELLLHEVYRSESQQDLIGSWGYWHVMETGTKEERKLLQSDEPDTGKLKNLLHKYKVTPQLYQMLEQHMKELQAAVSSAGGDKLVQELMQMADSLRSCLAAPRALKEW